VLAVFLVALFLRHRLLVLLADLFKARFQLFTDLGILSGVAVIVYPCRDCYLGGYRAGYFAALPLWRRVY
jgi:hypothetical protein